MFDFRKIGTVLLIFGLLAWVPFIYLVASGREPSIFPFLIAHLIGVVSGTRLRARGTLRSSKDRPRRQVVGRIMIILGVLAWVPYLYQNHLLGQPVAIAPYLLVHLTGVFGGIILLLIIPMERAWRQTS